MSLDFDLVYVKSRKRAIRELFIGTMGISGTALSPEAREFKAVQLALHGEIVDPILDAYAGDPWLVMQNRSFRGLTTVPALLQKLPDVWLDPGVHVPNVPDYDPSLWKIPVITDINLLVPYNDPTPETNYVGLYAGGGLYNVINNPEKVFVVGDAHTENGMNFTLLGSAIGMYFWQFVSRG